MKFLITEKFHECGIELFKKNGTVDTRYNICREELLECIREYDVLIVRSDTPVDKKVIDCGKRLKVIGMAGIGLNHIDTEYAREKGIAVFNVPDGSNDSVAEHTIALLLCISRKLYNAIDAVKKNHWNKTGYIGNQLKGKTIGLIAIGKIGSRVANLCQAFGMKVMAYDPFIDPDLAAKMNIELVSLEELLMNSDIISMHAPLTPQTYHMIGKKQLDMMKDGAYILNLGRGGLIDEEALYDALKKGKLKGAAVDVMEKEPPGQSKLLELDNFIATPHIGAGTVEAQQYIAQSLASKVIDYMKSLEV
jgi:D-3-phosphoglycerate dehydrogenase